MKLFNKITSVAAVCVLLLTLVLGTGAQAEINNLDNTELTFGTFSYFQKPEGK